MKQVLSHGLLFAYCIAFTPAGAYGQQALDPEIQAKINKGFQLAPVPLNMTGRDSSLVGYGSYLVNAVGDCNGCHSAGPQSQFSQGGNPFFTQYPKVNPATYLGGNYDFGAFPDAAGPFPHIVSRNLTPDKTGKAVGGDSLQEFMLIMRTGIDPDKLHPTCTGAPDGKCLPPPFNGNLLQIMPWPAFSNMTDRDLAAIYEYLSAIPCVENVPAGAEKRCGSGTSPGPDTKTAAVAGPKNFVALSRLIQLDGTKSVSGPGGALTYLWTIPAGSPSASMRGGDTATPTIQLGQGRGIYTFMLTVTDSAGTSASDTVTVDFQGN